MKKFKHKGISLILVLAIIITSIMIPAPGTMAATSSKIKIYDFIKIIVQATGLEVKATKSSPYLKAALKAEIVKDSDFKDYKAYLTRTDAAVILNRADEYLHGDKVDTELLTLVLSNRISDIKKIDASKRESVAKSFIKGFMKGYSKGYYIKSREFRGSEYMTASEAKGVSAMLKDTKKRAKLSPDGQLIRTTNLPSNANKFEYILETYPNSFYELKFSYQRGTYSWKPVEGKDYAPPTKITSVMEVLETDESGMCIYVNDWMKKAEDNLKYRLNVDYHTIDNTWLNNLRRTYTVTNNASLDKEKTDQIKNYVKYVKKNNVVIKSSIISVEPSTLYKTIGGYQVRAYIKFKISFLGDKMLQENLFFGNTRFVDLNKDKWFEGVYDIDISTKIVGTGGSGYAVIDDTLNDFYYKGK